MLRYAAGYAARRKDLTTAAGARLLEPKPRNGKWHSRSGREPVQACGLHHSSAGVKYKKGLRRYFIEILCEIVWKNGVERLELEYQILIRIEC